MLFDWIQRATPGRWKVTVSMKVTGVEPKRASIAREIDREGCDPERRENPRRGQTPCTRIPLCHAVRGPLPDC